MKTIKLTGEALELARQLSWMVKEGGKRVEQLQADIDAVQATLNKEYAAKMKEILAAAGVEDDAQGSVDATYLDAHGDAYVRVMPKQDLASLLEGVVGRAVMPQETVQ